MSATALADALADERMLEPEQFEQFVGAMLPMCQDVPILVKELVYRQWLSPFQVEQILAGKGQSLFLGSYVLIEPLGEGGMGRVFRARNWKLNRQVAVKVIREEQARQQAVVARFQREIRALGRIRHPNIIMAIDADFQPGSIWYAMEYVEGIDLGCHVRTHGPMAIEDACDCIVQIADALQHAHDCGLVHRDIKPSNLILCHADRSIKLLDLGLTRCEVPLDDSAFGQLTHVGALIGTPDFMAPEQIKDSHSAEIRSDLYSLGCTFYFLLAGRAPFDDVEGLVDKLFCQCESEPIPLEQLRPDVPVGLADIVRTLMAKRPRDRFQSSTEVIAALLRLHNLTGHPGHETLHNSPMATLTHSTTLPLRIGPTTPTVMLSHFDLELVDNSAEDLSEKLPAAAAAIWLSPIRIAIAVLIAALALVLFWRSIQGPDSLRGKAAPIEAKKADPPLEQELPAGNVGRAVNSSTLGGPPAE